MHRTEKFVFLCIFSWFQNVVTQHNFIDPSILRLGQHSVYPDWITLSGFSSGGTFAQQLQFSHSSLFSGLASFSHAYYRCGRIAGRESVYDDACTLIGANTTYNPELALADIRQYERQGLIDDTRNLRNKRLYVYAPMRSSFFDLDLGLAVVRIYEPFIKNSCAIKTRVQDAAQIFPTKYYGRRCTQTAEDNYFLANCNLSGAFEALEFLLGGITRIREPPSGFRADLQMLMSFDQTEFFYGFDANEHLMDTVGFIFVPRQCYFRSCFLHLYFHGCLTGRNYNGTGANHLINSGYLELAELNDVIILAPQALGNEENIIECWDVYGLTGRQYATKRGAQVTIVRNMLAKILGETNHNGIKRIQTQTSSASSKTSATATASVQSQRQPPASIFSVQMPSGGYSYNSRVGERYYQDY